VVAVRERWNDLIPGAAPLADDLASRYVGRQRRAYREHYLDTVLTTLDTLVQLCTDPTSVRLAAWFHRAVHEPGAGPAEDAEASARLAEQTLPAYGVSPVRVAEVARLVRLTGRLVPPSPPSPLSAPDGATPPRPDANADVLLDAVNSVLAAAPARYTAHVSELRRDQVDQGESRHHGHRGAGTERRYAEVRELLDRSLFRTGLARERLSGAARRNLETELAVLDSELPAPWRGWQLAALAATATFSAVAAAIVAIAGAGASWHVPVIGPEPVWPSLFLAVLAFVGGPVLFRSTHSRGRRAKLVAVGVILTAVVGLLIALARVPVTNAASGVGLRVPLLVSSLLLLLVAGVAALGASLLRARTVRFLPARNRGQQLAWLAVPLAIALVLLLLVQPLARDYVLAANERVQGDHPPAGEVPRSAVDGGVAWISRSTGGVGAEDAVGTRYGIAVPRQTGAVEMLDPQTGALRWRYSRSDSEEKPHLYVTGGGSLLLAEFADVGYLLLDADTGRRRAAWPGGTRDHSVQQADPLLTREEAGRESDKLRGVDADGHERWTFEPGRCTDISAVATADTVVTLLGHGCGGRSDELTGLDLGSGKELWRRTSGTYRRPIAVGGVVVMAEPGGDGGGPAALVAIEPRTGATKWRWRVPPEWSCRTLLNPAGDLLVVVDCPGADGRANRRTVVTALDVASGRIAWQTTAPVDARARVAVTTDGRVVSLARTSDGCWANVISRSGYRRARLSAAVSCSNNAHAIGNLVLTSSNGNVIALR
jgi:predicted metal-dependent HD superfamily phosphohydrolase/outer membrane protein assembly factor BamB